MTGSGGPAPVTIAELASALSNALASVKIAFAALSLPDLSLELDVLTHAIGVDYSVNPDKFAAAAIAFLQENGLLARFSSVFRAEMESADPVRAQANMATPIAAGASFYTRTVKARCRILRGNTPVGSGFLVGPSLVMTCAHVVMSDDDGDQPLLVELSDTKRIGVRSPFKKVSNPSQADHDDPMPQSDNDFPTHDFALLRLASAVGPAIPQIRLPANDWQPTVDAAVMILHFPEGNEEGVGNARLLTFNSPSLRWTYKAPTMPGSSGGACFNANMQLIGIHQGRVSNGRRLIPLRCFANDIRDDIAQDTRPPELWSMDGQITGPLVIGRDDLFSAVARMSESQCGFRTLRIRRVDPSAGPDGLGFSVELILRLIQQSPLDQRIISLGWPQALFADFDIITSLATVAAEKELIPVVEEVGNGIAPGETGFATVASAQADLVARQLQNAAERADLQIWIVVEHCQSDLGRQIIALEALADAVRRWPRLRLVIVGNEALRLPGDAYTMAAFSSDRPPVDGTLVEYLRPLTHADIVAFIARAYEDRMGSPVPAELANRWGLRAIAAGDQDAKGDGSSKFQRIVAELRQLLSTLDPAT